jgi:hypothetical protein
MNKDVKKIVKDEKRLMKDCAKLKKMGGKCGKGAKKHVAKKHK